MTGDSRRPGEALRQLTKAPLVAIRADASTSIGTGHVVRCLALADALRTRGADIIFLSRLMPDGMRAKIAELQYSLIDIGQFEDDATACAAALAGCAPVDVMIVDHYALGAEWERAMRPMANRIAVIDDLADRTHDADIVVDQNFHRRAGERYAGLLPRHCRVLLGPRFALLRRQFADARESPGCAVRAQLRHLLICFGGTDEHDFTSRAVQAFIAAQLPGVSATVIVGGGYAHWNALERRCAGIDGLRLLRDVADMAEEMSRADAFLGSGGAITWERAALKLPGITIAIADNQRQLCLELAETGAGMHLDVADVLLEDAMSDALRVLFRQPSLLRAFSERIGGLTDGRGAARVAARLLPVELNLRRASSEDCDAIFAWRNAPATRRHSHDPRPLDIEEHRAWYAKAIEDSARRLLIAERGSPAQPVGVLRYDLRADAATISVYLVPGLQGAGFGAALIQHGDLWLRDNCPDIRKVVAEVQADNTPSLRAFASAGYRVESEQMIHLFEEECRG